MSLPPSPPLSLPPSLPSSTIDGKNSDALVPFNNSKEPEDPRLVLVPPTPPHVALFTSTKFPALGCDRERGRGVEEGGLSIEETRWLGAVSERELYFSLSSLSPCSVTLVGNCVTTIIC